MAQISAVIFDADGVMVHPWRFQAYLRETHAISPEVTSDFFSGIFLECLTGRADLKEVLPSYLDKWDWPFTLQRFLDIWHEVEHATDSYMVGVVAALKEKGLLCALASNQERYRAEYMREQMGFSSLFDYTFFSSDLGTMKPETDYYHIISERTGIPGEEILFFDDSKGAVEGALSAGWNAIHFTGRTSLEEAFLKHLPGILSSVE